MKIATYLSSALFLLSGNYLQAKAVEDVTSSQPQPLAKTQKVGQYTDRIIVKMNESQKYGHEKIVEMAIEATGEKISYVRAFSDGTGLVLKLDRMAKLEDVQEIALAIKNTQPNVKYAKPDVRMFPMATTPNDEFFTTRQWNLQSSATQGLNLPAAWDYTTGSSDVVVAVLDTGILKDHTGFDSARLLAGFDMVSIIERAGDADGQDDLSLIHI